MPLAAPSRGTVLPQDPPCERSRCRIRLLRRRRGLPGPSAAGVVSLVLPRQGPRRLHLRAADDGITTSRAPVLSSGRDQDKQALRALPSLSCAHVQVLSSLFPSAPFFRRCAELLSELAVPANHSIRLLKLVPFERTCVTHQTSES
ncbi:hypothetical protein ACP70R_042285 [Stipagrostis hirtigluma subsp. patula]